MRRTLIWATHHRAIVAIAVSVAVVTGAVFGLVWNGSIAFEHPEQRVPVAHASMTEAGVQMGCASCHTNPINVSCSTCHTAPPTSIAGVRFPHHTAGEDGPTCNECHTQGGAPNGDVRNVIVPAALDHAYCTKCHSLEHN